MSPFWGQLAGVMIVLMLLSFIGIWIWAWRRYHQPVFDRMAQLPMQDEGLPVDGAAGEKAR
ncbi:cbb3-type cytochrome oxidase subunit 3 [Rhodanobacter geophilus]|uniref:Cbb3-type cytochrome oxidase subunit 3 n=1 Tax=Rhodanobacter geophilus TaxID=3162488 RepID=A0ABV3QR39_9GAMM